MPSKLKQRRLRRLKADLAWWREEAEDCRSRLLELAGEIDRVRAQIVRVPMPVVVPSALIAELAMEKAVERLNDLPRINGEKAKRADRLNWCRLF